MAILNQKKILNLIPKISAPVTIHVSQGDVGTQIEFTLIKGDEVFVNPGNVSASVHGVREDGANFGPFTCTLSGSKVTFPLHSEMTAVKGSALAEIVLVDNGGNKVGSANFGILVEESVFPLGVTYDNDVSVYESILAYAQTIPAQVQGEIAAITNAISTEKGERESSDANLQSQINQIVAPSGEAPSAAEVQNARIGANQITYDTLGDAIRGQIEPLIPAAYIRKFASVTTNAGYNAYYLKAGETVRITKTDGTAFTNATVYFFNASKVEIDHFALTSGVGSSREITPSANVDTCYIRLINNDNVSANYTFTNISSLYQQQIQTINDNIAKLGGTYVASMNANTDFTEGCFRVGILSGTIPNGFGTSGNVLMNNKFDGWVVQKLFKLIRPDLVWVRYIQISNPQYVWHKLNDNNMAKSGANLDDIIESGNYTVSSPTGTLPSDYNSANAALLKVTGYGENGYANNTPRWIIQELCYYNSVSTRWIRLRDVTTNTWSDWGHVSISTVLKDKKIVCFGDSITGNFQPPYDYPSMIAAATGATVYNLGVGGATMASVQGETRQLFSMVELTDSIVAEDYTAQEESGVSVTYAGENDNGFYDTGIDYIPTRISTLKAIDWSSVDIVTIAYGTNDWSNGHHIDNNENQYDKTTFLGALRYSIEALLTKYPHLKILVITPAWRWDTETPYKDSDTWQLYNNYLYDMADGEIEVAKSYHFIGYNQYWECGFNKFNRHQFFFSNDGTHPKLSGRKVMAEKITKELLYNVI